MKVSLRSNICEMNKNKSHIFLLVTVTCIAGIVVLSPISAIAKSENKIVVIKKENAGNLKRVDPTAILEGIKPISIVNSNEDSKSKSTQEKSEKKELPKSYIIEGFPIINQMPELPTGCEITAMTMVLNYYGYRADKVEMATQYLPILYEAEIYTGEDGKIYGSDINQYFIGDPTTVNGIICGTGAIVTAVNQYLDENGSTMRAIAKKGVSPEKLYQWVSEDTPVVVWCTIDMADRYETSGWYTENGDYVEWSQNDHGAVLIGYDENHVTIADPITGVVEYEKEQFESVFKSRGSQCVILGYCSQ